MALPVEFAAAIAMGLSAIGAAYAIATTGAAAIGATAEKPEVGGKVLIIVALAEAVAIYGLVIAVLILLPSIMALMGGGH